ncbi:MAG: S-layer homology domain-containing protein, partial [Candidatus Margulisbacteria bacterium]|nr:S-layer homology domain-containing protein [Candidatus Margulisiibacteriota bacterium]
RGYQFPDLKGHWLDQTASKLHYLGVLPQTSLFRPKGSITRLECAVLIQNLYQLEDKPDLERPLDMPEDHLNLEAVRSVMGQGVFSVDDQKNFYPNRTLTRMELLAAVVRVSRF